MAFSKRKAALFGLVLLSMAVVLPAKEDLTATRRVSLHPSSIAELKVVTATLGKIGGSNKLLGAVVSPIQSLCKLCTGGVLPGVVGLLQIIVSAILALVSAILTPLLGGLLGALDPTLGKLLGASVAKLLSCILLETSFLVKGLLGIIVGLLCLLLEILF